MRESDRERAWRLLELDPEESLGAPRVSLLRFASTLRRRLSRGRFSSQARRAAGAARARLMLRLGLPDAAVDAADAEVRGEALVAAGRPAEAVAALAGTQSFWGRLWLAEALRRTGDARGAARASAAARRQRPSSPWPLLVSGRADRPTDLDRALVLAPQEPWALLARGWRRLDAGRAGEAEIDLTAGLARAKGNKWGLVLRARARLLLGRFEEARTDLEAALALDPDLGSSRRAWRPGDERGPELRALDAAIAGRPGEGWLRAWRGQLDYDALRPETALDDLRRAVALDPSCGWARAFLARAESLWLGTEAAERELARAFADAPACGWILLWRGLLRARRGDAAGAGRDYASAASRHPGYALARGWLGNRRRELGNLKEALAELDVAAELDPSYGFHFERRRRTLWRLGRHAAAFEDMALAVRRESRFRWADGGRPEDLARAEAELTARLAEAPGDADARAWRGETRLAAGDLAGAREDLVGSLAPWPRAWRAELLLASADAEGALREADASLAGDPSYARAWGAKARALASLGRGRAAIAALDRVTELDFGAAWAYCERGRLRLAAGRRGAAAADLRRALALDRGMDEARRLLGLLEAIS
jgi:tetratricopeptide (TPR) repeat protein